MSFNDILSGRSQEVPVSQLAALNDALRKAADAGYQTPAGTSGGDAGSYSPLVPQSIDNVLSSATYTMDALSIWKDIPKKSVINTVHEYGVINEHGADLDPFFAEGGVPGTNRASYERKSVRIKYLAERREVTDVAGMVGLIGADPNAIAAETMRGTMNLLQKVEKQLWHGDSSVNSLAFDGLFKQMEDNAPRNVTDNAGSAVTAQDLSEALAEVMSEPNYGTPDTIYVEPRVFAELQRQSFAHGRHDQTMIALVQNLFEPRGYCQASLGIKGMF